MFKYYLTFTAVLILSVIGITLTTTKTRERNYLVVAYPKHWVSIVPALQHTLAGDAAISNQFEPLVEIGVGGSINPLSAYKWEVSDNYRKFTFYIDTSKRFSNGDSLTAKHFKDSWEYGLRLKNKSFNKSTEDVLYQLVGYEAFDNNLEITGIKTKSENILELTFKNPFRQALEHLTGPRFSAFIHTNDIYLGTGPYIIKENIDHLFLTVNPYHPSKNDLDEIKIIVVEPEKARDAIKNNEIDIYEFASHLDPKICTEFKNLECFYGEEASHIILSLNGLPGKLFHSSEDRLAFQSLVFNLLKSKKNKYENLFTSISHHFYLPYQKGRLDDQELSELMRKGETYVQKFREKTITNPLKFATFAQTTLLDDLKSEGIHFTQDSGVKPWNEIVHSLYKSSDLDVYFGTFSVVSGDPDGLYHAMGKNGAILFPMAYRTEVANLLEDGRTITDPKQVDESYRNVSRSIYRNVPHVHFGFYKQVSLYDKTWVSVNSGMQERNDHRLFIYKLRK